MLLYSILGIFFVICVFSWFFVASNQFTWVGINQAVIYHLFAPAHWADFSSNIWKIITFILFILGWIITVFFAQKYLKNHIWKWNSIAAITFMIFSIFMHPGAKDVYELTYGFYKVHKQIGSKVDENFIPQVEYQVSNETKNLVYLYLESFESQYLDWEKFPWLTPNISKLSQQNTSFNNVRQLPWTGWTIAGMVSTQCAIPLILWNTGVWDTQRFYPKAECMWDILSKNGYNLSYVWWADRTFAGKDAFYKTHNFQEVLWKQDIEWNHLENSWGLYDETTLEIFYEKYLELSQKKEKFGLFWLTLDTHWPNGFVSPSCPVYIQEKNNILNAIHCTDYLVWELINKIQTSQYYDNTLIVLWSDHLQMWTQKNHKLSWWEFDRTNLFLLLDNGEKVYNNLMSTLDIWPIVLSQIWIQVDEMWFWKNILNGHISFVEKYYQTTQAKDDFYHARKVLFWYKQKLAEFLDFPYLTKKILINNKEKKLILADQEYSYPLIIYFDEDKKIYDVILSEWNSYDLASYEKTGSYLRIDECRKINPQDTDSNQYCYTQNIENQTNEITQNQVVKVK